MALDSYSTFGTLGETTLGEATTVSNFVNYVLNTEGTGTSAGGQVVIKNHDYLPLSGVVLERAKEGAAEISF